MPVVLVCDVEGCVVPGLGQPWDLRLLAELAGLIKRLPFSVHLCSGRPVQYVEGVLQALGLETVAVCEGGAVLFEPRSYRVEILVPEEAREMMSDLRLVLERDFAARGGVRVSVGKEVCVSLVPLREEGARPVPPSALMEPLEEFLELRFGRWRERFSLTYSASAVDITPRGVDKGTGVKALLERLGVSPKKCMGVGDGRNDLPFLTMMGRRACPGNADQEVKAVSSFISPYHCTAGVKEILEVVSRT